MALSSMFQILKKNTRVTRRQACRLGAVLGLFLSAPNAFRAKHVFAKNRRIFKKEAPLNLPAPILNGDVSLEKAIKQRRTERSFAHRPLMIDQLSQILWAGQGITGDRGLKRAAPSGGALYPIDLYAVVGKK